jgi:putative transposase
MWASENEGAKFWLGVVTELKNRGVRDIFIACVDGLKGFPEAIETVFPKTTVQLCLVHLVRYSLAYGVPVRAARTGFPYVSFKDRKALVADLKMIYRAVSLEEAESQLEAFAAKWDSRYPMISKSWRSNWARVIPMFGLPEDIRRAVYTTNAIESLNMSLRKIIKRFHSGQPAMETVKCRSSFPNEEAAFKLLYLALQNAAKKWTMPIPNWSRAMN